MALIPTKSSFPSLQQRWTDERLLRARMQELPTRFLFTYGQEEMSTYKMEAYERLTMALFRRVAQRGVWHPRPTGTFFGGSHETVSGRGR